jgi:simple sugar transport system permease protein
MVGAVLTGAIDNGLTLLGVNPFLTPITTGIVLLLAIWINMRGHGIVSALAGLRRMADTKIG